MTSGCSNAQKVLLVPKAAVDQDPQFKTLRNPKDGKMKSN